jgi:hypothetical protein
MCPHQEKVLVCDFLLKFLLRNEIPNVLRKLKKVSCSNGWVKEENEVIVEQGKAIFVCGLPCLFYGN